jgi:hypothetical protein
MATITYMDHSSHVFVEGPVWVTPDGVAHFESPAEDDDTGPLRATHDI